jgi:hypothetical protein
MSARAWEGLVAGAGPGDLSKLIALRALVERANGHGTVERANWLTGLREEYRRWYPSLEDPQGHTRELPRRRHAALPGRAHRPRAPGGGRAGAPAPSRGRRGASRAGRRRGGLDGGAPRPLGRGRGGGGARGGAGPARPAHPGSRCTARPVSAAPEEEEVADDAPDAPPEPGSLLVPGGATLAGERAGEELPQAAGGERGGPAAPAGRDRGAAGAQRGGEDHQLLHDGGADPPGPRPRLHRRPRPDRRADVPPGAGGDRVPVAGAVRLPPADGGGERDGDPADDEASPAPSGRSGWSAARRAVHQAPAPHAGLRPLGRRAAAAGDHPRAGGGAQVHAPGRALRGGGPDRGARHPADRQRPAPARHRGADLGPQRGADARHRGPRLHHVRRPRPRVGDGGRAGVERRGGGDLPRPHPHRSHAGALSAPGAHGPGRRGAGGGSGGGGDGDGEEASAGAEWPETNQDGARNPAEDGAV